MNGVLLLSLCWAKFEGNWFGSTKSIGLLLLRNEQADNVERKYGKEGGKNRKINRNMMAFLPPPPNIYVYIDRIAVLSITTPPPPTLSHLHHYYSLCFPQTLSSSLFLSLPRENCSFWFADSPPRLSIMLWYHHARLAVTIRGLSRQIEFILISMQLIWYCVTVHDAIGRWMNWWKFLSWQY